MSFFSCFDTSVSYIRFSHPLSAPEQPRKALFYLIRMLNTSQAVPPISGNVRLKPDRNVQVPGQLRICRQPGSESFIFCYHIDHGTGAESEKRDPGQYTLRTCKAKSKLYRTQRLQCEQGIREASPLVPTVLVHVSFLLFHLRCCCIKRISKMELFSSIFRRS